MKPSEVIVRPIITERATEQKERNNLVTFEVTKTANKYQIKDAVESLYGVTVTDVRTSVSHGKVKRRGMSFGKRPNWKKAMVSLKEGDNIDFFAQE